MRPAIDQRAASYPMADSSAAPMKKPTPFRAFFEPVRIATRRNSAPSPATNLTALLELILVRSLATPESAWAPIPKATDSHSRHSG